MPRWVTPGHTQTSGQSRFISQDPIGHTGGTNLYQYALNNPTTHTDPSGNTPGLLVGCAVGGLVAGALDWGVQYAFSGRKVNWVEVAGAALLGCLEGGITGAAVGQNVTRAGRASADAGSVVRPRKHARHIRSD